MNETAVTLSTETALIPADAQARLDAALAYSEGLKSITITTDQEESGAAAKLRELRGLLKELDERKRRITAPWKEKASEVDRAFKRVSDACKLVEDQVARALSVFTMKKRAEAERRQRELEAKAAEERRKAEEKARLEREKADKLREAGKIEQAEKAEARADFQEEKASVTVAPVIEAKAAEGITMVDHWEVTVVDKLAAARALLDNVALSGCVTLDTAGLEQMCTLLEKRGEHLSIPGLRFENHPRPRLKGR